MHGSNARRSHRDGKYILHPAILDSTFHACVHPTLTKSTDPNIYFLPAKVNSVTVYESMDRQAFAADHVYAHVTFQSWQPCESRWPGVVLYGCFLLN